MITLKAVKERLKKRVLLYLSRENLKYKFQKKALNIIGDQKILMAGMISHNPGLKIESFLALELLSRGSNIEMLGCDSAFEACLNCEQRYFNDKKEFIIGGPKKNLCSGCQSTTKYQFKNIELKSHWIGDYIKDEYLNEANEIIDTSSFKDLVRYKSSDNIKIGDHAISGTLRFLAKGVVNETCSDDINIFYKYFKSSYIFYKAFNDFIHNNDFDVFVFHHGIYITHGIMGEIARSRNIRVVNWNLGYKSNSLIFSHNDTYHHTLMEEDVDSWKNIKLSINQQAKIKEYLYSRQYGSQDWIYFHGKPKFKSGLLQKLEKSDKKKILILTNVFWDAQLHYPKNVFDNMLDWLLSTIEFFSKNNSCEVIVRIHPAELRGTVPSNQKMIDEINSYFKEINKNIHIIEPENPLSTYSLFELTDVAIIYGTKTGVELTAYGIPTIVAGEAWIKNKGLTLDPIDKDEYFKILADIQNIVPLNEEIIDKAILYAYHFFFRRMIPVNFIEHDKYSKFKITKKPTSKIDNGLDVICDGIIHGKEFIYPAEELDK